MLTWSIATVSMGGTLEAKLTASAKAGFSAVELFENDVTFFNGRPRDIATMASDLGLTIIALQPMRDFEGMPEPQRTRNFDRARRKFDLMAELGTDLLCLCSNIAPEALGEPARLAQDLAELAQVAASYNKRLGYEALAWGRHVRDWVQAWELVRMANAPNLGLVLDSFHACARNNPLAPIASVPADKIALVQVADAPQITMDVLALSRHHRCYPGQGDFAIDEFLNAVVATGYRGYVSLEIFNEQFRGAPASMMAQDGMRALQLSGERLQQGLLKHHKPLLPDLPALPKAPDVTGVGFLEFAVNGQDRLRLAGLLEGLGFVLVGRHRSKSVALYRQGDIYLVLNHESEGFAHAFHLIHGTGVCAVAFRVANVADAEARAKAFGAGSYYGRIGLGEAVIPATNGVEGSLIYFVADSAQVSEHVSATADNPALDNANHWERDFILTQPLDKTPVALASNLTTIDHFSNIVRRPEFLSWMLFYQAVLDLQREPQVEIADPYGALYSRALRAQNKSVRIALNVADGGATANARFLEAFGGAGVQQIAFACSDIFAAVDHATKHGVQFLAIPQNYYEDLVARYDLAPDFLAKLQSFGILYDRRTEPDGGVSELLHVYTQTFDGRFFFEILERRNGYDGFGEVNTPVRLAAQARADAEARESDWG